LISRDVEHRALYQVFLDVRDAAAQILENTTLADLIKGPEHVAGKSSRRSRKKRTDSTGVLPMVVHGTSGLKQ
jgi:DNA-binding IscR family transcriptional regulator